MMLAIKSQICQRIESIVYRETTIRTKYNIWEMTRSRIRIPIIDSVLESAAQVRNQVREDLDVCNY
jgi:hypothetical protein